MLKQNDLYPTRAGHEFLAERKDPIIYGTDTHPKRLRDEQVRAFRKNGFVVIPGVFSQREAACIKRRIGDLKRENKAEKHRLWTRSIPSGECESLFAPEKRSAVFESLAREPRILERVGQIVASPVYLHRSRVHIQNGLGGSSYPWHSEFEAWHAEDGVPRMRGVEAWLLLTESKPRRATFRMLARSHHIYVSCQGAGNGSNTHSAGGFAGPSSMTLTRLLYFGGMVEACGAPGTLVLCDSNLMYGSSENPSGRPRVTVMLGYNSMQNIPADSPFSADEPRPEPLVNREPARLKAREFDFCGPSPEPLDGMQRRVRAGLNAKVAADA